MKRYATPLAFREALEFRLRAHARRESRDLNRLRMRLVMDRFAARIAQVFGEQAVLKGGLVLELRLATARSTKDLDVYLRGSAVDALPRLQEAGRLELPDHLRFDVVADARHSTIQAEGMRYEGLRFRAQAHLAGKV